MAKKLFLPLIIIFSVVFLVSCDTTNTTEIITEDMTTTEMTTTIEPTTTEITTTIETVVLPDFDGVTLDDIESQLTSLGLTYEINYMTNKNQTEGLFIRYGQDYQAGDTVQINETITVHVYSHDIYLPDLTGLSQEDVLNYFFGVGITNFNFDVITDNTVEDETFAGYEGYQIGDQVTPEDTIIVFIGFNDEKIPELDGLIKRQVETIYNDLDINYIFSYVVDDDYPEDEFAYYENVNAGDFYEDDELTVEIVLYKNTFTDAETSLMISKYVDGDIDSAIELYNPTDASIDLSEYYIAIYSGGSYEITYTIPLEDEMLLPGETYLIVSKDSEPNLQRFADLRADDLLFDGFNDTIQLCYQNGTYIDTIYQIGDRGSDMDNEIFVRREGVVSGTRTFNLGEWTAFVPDYYDIIGSHPLDIEDELTYTIQEISAFIVNTFDSPYGGMNEVEYRGVADGDTAYFFPGFMESERVRFIGNDTPETFNDPQPWGLEAKAYTRTILEYADANNKSIYVQSDPDVGYTETYGRHLGIIWVDLGDDVLSIDIMDSSGTVLFTEELTGIICINYLLVKNGFSADEYSSTSTLTINNRYMHRWFDEAEKFAKDNHLGIYEE